MHAKCKSQDLIGDFHPAGAAIDWGFSIIVLLHHGWMNTYRICLLSSRCVDEKTQKQSWSMFCRNVNNAELTGAHCAEVADLAGTETNDDSDLKLSVLRDI